MNWIIDNWFVLVAISSVIICALCIVINFANQPNEEQKAKIKQWLIWACIEAERELQSGTGQLKLRKVYNKFISIPAFSGIAKVMSFEMFSDLVAESLDRAKSMIISNKALAAYVYGENVKEEVEKLKMQMGA